MSIAACVVMAVVCTAVCNEIRRGVAARRRRERQRFEMAAARARKLAFEARIIDARIEELTELVVEQAMLEIARGADGWDGDTEGR